jgi:hypothetical protein
MDVGFKIYEEEKIFCFFTLPDATILQVQNVFVTEGVHVHLYKPSRETSGKELMSR